jgi:synaptojanin
LIQGYFGQCAGKLGDLDVIITLMSRRVHHRAGTRYNARGIDDHGYVGNQCETEQILVVDNRFMFSHVQVRGTIPVFWEQKGIMEDVTITRNPEMTKKAFRTHFSDIINTYGPVYCINLLRDKTAREMRLTREYVRQVYESDLKENIKFLNFDFHHYCGGDKYQALKVMV